MGIPPNMLPGPAADSDTALTVLTGTGALNGAGAGADPGHAAGTDSCPTNGALPRPAEMLGTARVSCAPKGK